MTVKRTVEANRPFCMVEKPQMRKLSVQVTNKTASWQGRWPEV